MEECCVSQGNWRVSFYASGRRTANGERFNPDGLTAAHRTLPFGTMLRVENPRTHQAVVVRVTDRGPFVRGRQLDLARGAAQKVGLHGVANLTVTVIDSSSNDG